MEAVEKERKGEGFEPASKVKSQDVIVLCVNLTGLEDAQVADKTLLLGVSVKVLEEISI